MPNQYVHPWTPEEIDFLEKNIKRITYKQMGKFIMRTPSSIQSKIRHLPFQTKVKKHKLNISFFKNLSPSVAYVLGFIAADGNICHSGRAHTLHIACDDKDVIEKIKMLMEYDGPIYEKKRDNGKVSYSLRICDKTIFTDLQELGITERKSFTICPPKLSRDLVSHFIRGYFDGDGSVFSLKSPRYSSQNLGVHFYTASFLMAKYIYKMLKSLMRDSYKGRVRSYLAHQKNKFFVINLGATPSKKLFKYMYKDSNGLYMDRKYKKFIQGVKYVT